MRADLFLVDRGLATTRSQAQRLIASGVQWRADVDSAWRKVAKNGDEIPEGAELVVPDTTEAKYISRGGLKLEGALQSTGLKVAGWRCLDVGQSTGGFTDCLLQQAIGEATSGLAHIEATPTGHFQARALQRAFELEPAPRDVLGLGRVGHDQLGTLGNFVAVLGHLAPGRIDIGAPLHARSDQALRLRAGGGQATVNQKKISTHSWN